MFWVGNSVNCFFDAVCAVGLATFFSCLHEDPVIRRTSKALNSFVIKNFYPEIMANLDCYTSK